MRFLNGRQTKYEDKRVWRLINGQGGEFPVNRFQEGACIAEADAKSFSGLACGIGLRVADRDGEPGFALSHINLDSRCLLLCRQAMLDGVFKQRDEEPPRHLEILEPGLNMEMDF